MNSLRDILETSPRLRAMQASADQRQRIDDAPQSLADTLWDWSEVRKVLLIRLRSIGDTVLATPSLYALKRFLPKAEIDILVEDWVAPVLSGHDAVDHVITLEGRSLAARARAAREIRSRRYDVVYNLHGGTTATFLTRASGARHRVGFGSYQYANLHNHQAPSPLLLWGQQKAHSAEQQLALLGWTGVPVTDRPRSRLTVTAEADAAVSDRLSTAGLLDRKFALIHPAAAFSTKQWAAANFARVAEFLGDRNIPAVAIAGPNEGDVLNDLLAQSKVHIVFFQLTLPEVTALAARAHLFVGNDSGIAHIAAAVGTRSVVVFGSSNIAHWRPWNTAPAEVVFEDMPCQPCHGYFCEKFPEPECILRVPVARVTAAVERVLRDAT